MSNKLYPRCRRGSACCAVGCTLTSGTNALSKIRMFTFPKNEAQRLAWIQAVGRKGWVPTSATRICSTHFLTGAPSKDPKHPDWVPSVFPCSISRNVGSKTKDSSCFKKENLIDFGQADEEFHFNKTIELRIKQEPDSLSDYNVDGFKETGSQTIVSGLSIEKLIEENESMKQSLCDKMENNSRTPTSEILKDSSLIQFYTGLDNKAAFLELLNHVENSGIHYQKYKLSQQDLLMLTLMKMRQGFADKDLGFRFGISSSMASMIFHELYLNLKDITEWSITK